MLLVVPGLTAEVHGAAAVSVSCGVVERDFALPLCTGTGEPEAGKHNGPSFISSLRGTFASPV